MQGIKFFVFAQEKEGSKYAFNMEKNDREWRIINAPKVPDVFMENEKQLSNIIYKIENKDN